MKCLYTRFEVITLDELKAVLENCKISFVSLSLNCKMVHSISVDESGWTFALKEEKMENRFLSKEKLLEHLDQTGLFKKQSN